MITLFLTGVVAMIMLRTLRKDISSYNEVCLVVAFHALLAIVVRSFCANAEKGGGVLCVAGH